MVSRSRIQRYTLHDENTYCGLEAVLTVASMYVYIRDLFEEFKQSNSCDK